MMIQSEFAGDDERRGKKDAEDRGYQGIALVSHMKNMAERKRKEARSLIKVLCVLERHLHGLLERALFAGGTGEHGKGRRRRWC